MKKNPLVEHVRKTALDSNLTDEQKRWPVVATLSGPTESIEIVVRLAAAKSGIEMNWGYVAGRGLVHSPGDPAVCRAAILREIPCSDIKPEEQFP